MTEKQKRDAGQIYNPNYDKELGLEYAHPITVGNNVVIGAGSVVTKDIPSGVMAFGNPCRVYRKLTEEEMK